MLFFWFTVRIFREHLSVCVCVCASFPFDFDGRILDLTVLISGHCLSFLSYDVSVILKVDNVMS